MTTTEQFTPMSLRDIIERGLNPLDHLAPGHTLQNLIELLQQATRVSVDGRSAEAQRVLAQLEWMLEHRHTGIGGENGDRYTEEAAPDAFARVTQMWRWRFDLLTDPDLIDMVASAMPAREAWEAMQEIDKARNANPLKLVLAEHWDSCDGCSQVIPPGGKALVVGSQPDYSDDGDLEAFAWCMGCVDRIHGLAHAEEVEG